MTAGNGASTAQHHVSTPGLQAAPRVQAHVKPCPKCTVPVEKNGGCNLVMCRSCRQTFCWLCGAKTGSAHTWDRIDGHTCGAWKEEQDRQIEDSRSRHLRYMHYFNHYTVQLSYPQG